MKIWNQKASDMKYSKYLLGMGTLVTVLLFTAGCGQMTPQSHSSDLEKAKIVSLNGTITEILVELGLEDQIVGVDVSSTYPVSMLEKPKVSNNRSVSAEGVLALGPTLIIGTAADLKEETLEQLNQTGVKTLVFDYEFGVEGSKSLIRAVADSLHLSLKADSILQALDTELQHVGGFQHAADKPRVLFIYARGAGSMMVGGKDTQVDEMIRLAGGVNVASDITAYKPLTAEALVAYNPQIILLFDSGMSSLGNMEGILELPGVRDTDAGRNRKIVHMDGQLLTGFSPRVAQAILELNQKITE